MSNEQYLFILIITAPILIAMTIDAITPITPIIKESFKKFWKNIKKYM